MWPQREDQRVAQKAISADVRAKLERWGALHPLRDQTCLCTVSYSPIHVAKKAEPQPSCGLPLMLTLLFRSSRLYICSFHCRVCGCTLPEEACTLAERMKGKYVSVKVVAPVQHTDVIAEAYDELGQDPRVIMKF